MDAMKLKSVLIEIYQAQCYQQTLKEDLNLVSMEICWISLQ
jgi:hypothetical protein